MGKLGNAVLIVLMVGFIFALVGSVVNDFETYYNTTDVDTSWASDYDYSDKINKSVSRIKDNFDVMGDEDKGWFSKVVAGITAVPEAIVVVPVVIFETMSYGITILSGLAVEVGIPSFVVPFAIVAIIVGIIFIAVSFWRRYPA